MPKWRRDNPESASVIAARYETSSHGKEMRSSYEAKRQRPDWYADARRMFDQLRSYMMPERGRRHSATRRARQREGGPRTRSALRSIRKIYDRCEELCQWFDVVVDHKIPLVKGGLHEAGNLQIIYAVENKRKGARLDYVPTVVFT